MFRPVENMFFAYWNAKCDVAGLSEACLYNKPFIGVFAQAKMLRDALERLPI